MSDISKQLIEHVQSARADGTKLCIVGRDSKAFMGRVATGEPIQLSGHSGIVSYQPVELVLTARAGTPLSEIEDALAEQGQMLSFESPRFNDQASIGGTLACNLSGPARPWAGSVRDLVLGIRLINGKAEELRFGGQVMKNVAGYDVSRMQAGAMGTLGIISEVSLKVMPKPDASETVVMEMDASAAIQKMNKLAATAKPLTGACWFDNTLYLRLSGAHSAVTQTVQQWGGDKLDNAPAFWTSLREQQLDYFAGDAPLWRFSLNSAAPHMLPDDRWLLDWGGAQRWLRGEHDPVQLEALAEDGGGQVSLYRGGNRLGDVFHRQGAIQQQLHQRLKAAFDPDALFNPGRLYRWM